ncbi:MAG: fumarylacetoacetase [Flavobacteriales bacterium]|nr:fumarylacetoacetase [Crocinitomicaceae bacterium]NBX80797.1 fumarylacetoacetase [Flavobacteriales bacterium]
MIAANNPALKSWVVVPENSDFSIQNLPFGIFKTSSLTPRVGVRIGDSVLDLKTLFVLGYLENLPFELSDFDCEYLNPMMKKGKLAVRQLRNRISKLLDADFTDLQKNQHHADQVLIDANSVEMCMPVQIGDYTDFYSSKEHATNVGIMFRDPANALLPNWLWIPVGYHGRASSVILSGQNIHRPKGQIKPNDNEDPIFAPSRQVDFELEMGFITFDGKPLGDSISTAEADEYIFGLCLFNDWSARDIQKWEYVPLGPFLAKNFASSMSAWIVTLDALQPYAVETPNQEPKVLSYLEFEGKKSYDIHLQVAIQPENTDETVISNSNFKYMYWNMAQQLAHHTINGCNIRSGDLMGSGTISGPTEDSYGSMLELCWKGTKPLKMNDGTERRFILDGDTVIMRGHCEANGIRIGFGEVKAKLLAAK